MNPLRSLTVKGESTLMAYDTVSPFDAEIAGLHQYLTHIDRGYLMEELSELSGVSDSFHQAVMAARADCISTLSALQTARDSFLMG